MFNMFYKDGLQEYKSEINQNIDQLKARLELIANELRTDINTKTSHLQNEINRKATDSDDQARQAALSAENNANRAISFANSIEENVNFLAEIRKAAEITKQEIDAEKITIQQTHENLKSQLDTTNTTFNQISDIHNTTNEILTNIKTDANKIVEYLEKSKTLPEQVEKTIEMVTQANRNHEDINNLLNHAINKKSEIDELHKSIYGTDIPKEDGSYEHTDGIKDQLENSYKKITENIKNLENTITGSTEQIRKKFEAQQHSQVIEFNSLVKSSTETIGSIKKQLETLLPGAMAAGLSAAYEDKKDEETKTLIKFEANFKNAIYVLVLISLIPFFIDVYLLGWKNHDLINVIKDTPNLIISILPIYFPILWLAYSSNKKINLSKRLIEEYTHKSVLGKTFSGLSNQIDTLPDDGKIKNNLRTQLLFSVLQVSAENPGKLITDYQKSDHPLMEALEKSAKLSDAVESLSKIPGFNSLAKTITEKADQLLNTQDKKVADGLSINSTLENNQNTNEEEKKENMQ